MVKPDYQQPIDAATHRQSIEFFEMLMKLLHPFMPFLTEEVWSELGKREKDDCIIVANWPTPGGYDPNVVNRMNRVFEVVSQIRNIRNQTQTSPREPLGLYIRTKNKGHYQDFAPIIHKLGNISDIEYFDHIPQVTGTKFLVREDEFLALTSQNSDPTEEKEALEKELNYTRGFLTSVEKKLANKRFVENAPEAVVSNEKKKRDDALARIQTLEEGLNKY